jgi:muramoyltetrapeptide carboxypeptidase
VSPGFGVRPAELAAGIRRLEDLGFRVHTGDHALDREGYLAGSDAARAEDFNRAIARPDVRAVWFARGGYGSARLLDRVRWDRLARAPKTLIGYSDVTALFAAASKRAHCPCLHGPVVAELGDPRRYHLGSLRRALRGEPSVVRFSKTGVVRSGRARGPLIGGNLTVLVHLLGTRWAPDPRGSILFLEDVGEPAYRLDRMLTHLRMSGWLRGVAGVVVGSFDAAPRRSFLKDRPVIDLVTETFAPLGIPVVTGLKAGHVAGKHTLPLLGDARLDTRAGTLRVSPRFAPPRPRR